MNAWQFPLQPLLDQSAHAEALERERFDRLSAELRRAQADCAALERAFDASTAAVRVADLDSRALRMQYGCSEQIVSKIAESRRRLESCVRAARAAGEQLARARSLRKSLEALKLRQLQRRAKSEERFEERELDEGNANRMSPPTRVTG